VHVLILQRALEFRSNTGEDAIEEEEEDESDPEEPRLALSTGDVGGEVVLTLTLNMYGVWHPEYVFSLLPVGLEKVDVLEAQTRDLQEECARLGALVAQLVDTSRPATAAFLSVSSAAACSGGQMVAWDAPAPREITASHFKLSADRKQVTIRVAGVYQMQVRLAVTHNSNGIYHSNSQQPFSLQRNGTAVAGCIQSDANGYQNTPQLFEVMRLQVGDSLEVCCNASRNSIADALANRFTVTYVGPA